MPVKGTKIETEKGTEIETVNGLTYQLWVPKTEEKEKAIQWYALPPNEREPKTLKALAAQLKCSERTLQKWFAEPGVVEGVRKEQRIILDDYVVDALKACGESAKKIGKEGAMDRKMLFSITGIDYSSKQKQVVHQTQNNINYYRAMPDDKLAEAMAKEMVAVLEESGEVPKDTIKKFKKNLLERLSPKQSKLDASRFLIEDAEFKDVSE